MRGSCTFGIDRQGLACPHVRIPAPITGSGGTVDNRLARVLVGECSRRRDGPLSGFVCRAGRQSATHGVRQILFEREEGGALFACRPERVPARTFIPALDGGGRLLVV